MNKFVAPSLGLKSFSCPHSDCGALAHQYWWRVFVSQYSNAVAFLDPAKASSRSFEDVDNPRERERLKEFAARLAKRSPTYLVKSTNSDFEIVNAAISRCHSCDGLAFWINGALIHPAVDVAHHPVADMPPDVRSDFQEAAAIYQKSPRGAAALLRLAIQRLMPHLGEKGKDLNADIGRLVQKGLDPVIKQALDVVRVVGNNAVHPGRIDFDDNDATASKLFGLVNLIVTTMITAKNEIAQMFDDLPETAKAQIQKRDEIETLLESDKSP